MRIPTSTWRVNYGSAWEGRRPRLAGRLAAAAWRAQIAPLHRASTQYRRDVAALKRQVTRLTKQVAFLEGQERGRVAKPAVVADSNAKARFSPLWLKKHRAKLDLSAEQYAQLAGASAQSIYFWESGKTKPRAAQVAALAALRGLGKREAMERLRVLGGV